MTQTSISDGSAHPSHTSGETSLAVGGNQSDAKPEAEVNDSIWNYPATYLLIGVNLLVFAAMYRYGPMAHLAAQHRWWEFFTASFDPDTLMRFGASDAQAVLAGQWYRLLFAIFVHVTVLHLLLNMFCLWNVGIFAEPLLGRRGVIAVYVITGVMGNMASLSSSLFNREDVMVAGASGAVFGLVGILIILLSNRKLDIPWRELKSLRLVIILFALLNLALGFYLKLGHPPISLLHALRLDPNDLPRIDNSAHLGGFLGGLALGIALFPKMTTGRASYRRRQEVAFAAAALLLCLFGYALTKFV